MKYKLIAVDVDNTLLNSKKELTPTVREALITAQKKGVKLAIATGRFPFGARKFAGLTDIFSYGGYYMSFNGGKVFDSRDRVISDTVLDDDLVAPIYNTIKDSTATAVVHTDCDMILNLKDNPRTAQLFKLDANSIIRVEDISKHVDWSIHKMILVDRHENLLPLKDRLCEKFGDRLNICFSQDDFLEILP